MTAPDRRAKFEKTYPEVIKAFTDGEKNAEQLVGECGITQKQKKALFEYLDRGNVSETARELHKSESNTYRLIDHACQAAQRSLLCGSAKP